MNSCRHAFETAGPPGGGLILPGRNAWRCEQADVAHVLVDGAEYFGLLRAALLVARRRVVILGWDIDSRMRLAGGVPPDDGLPEELGDFLTALVDRTPGLSIRILVWQSPLPYALDRETEVEQILQTRTPPQIEFAFDAELPSGSAQHQKIVVVDDAVAFSGGLDLTLRRWDTRDHRPGDPCRIDPAGKPYPPFHDVQMMVTGNAAAALGELAAERWLRATDEVIAPLPTGRSGTPPVPSRPHFRNVRVGIARTVPAVEGVAEVREVEALFEDMIGALPDVRARPHLLPCAARPVAIVERPGGGAGFRSPAAAGRSRGRRAGRRGPSGPGRMKSSPASTAGVEPCGGGGVHRYREETAMNTATITLLPRPTRLTTSVVEDVGTPGVWRVEAIDYGSGGIAQLTVFVGRDAERRARAYASWQYHPVLAAPAE